MHVFIAALFIITQTEINQDVLPQANVLNRTKQTAAAQGRGHPYPGQHQQRRSSRPCHGLWENQAPTGAPWVPSPGAAGCERRALAGSSGDSGDSMRHRSCSGRRGNCGHKAVSACPQPLYSTRVNLMYIKEKKPLRRPRMRNESRRCKVCTRAARGRNGPPRDGPALCTVGAPEPVAPLHRVLQPGAERPRERRARAEPVSPVGAGPRVGPRRANLLYHD